MLLLFQGDSVTDAGRSREDLSDLGPGYPKYTAALLQEAFPAEKIEFVNRGVSGDRTEQLVARLEPDFLAVKPDLVTILVGVNDSWHSCPPTNIVTTDEQFERNYRTVLDALAARSIPVVMLEPFCMPNPAIPDFRADLLRRNDTERRLAREYDNVLAYIPLDGLAYADAATHGTTHLTDDGVHPNEAGRAWISGLLADALKPILRTHFFAK